MNTPTLSFLTARDRHGAANRKQAMASADIPRSSVPLMTETPPSRPFDETEALAWLRAQPDGRVTASAAELGRQWGWNRMRAARRLRAWQKAGHILRNAEEIVVTASVTPAATEATGVVLEATATRRSMTPVKRAAFIVALVLACVSAAFSIDGLTAIFAGAFWPVIVMGAALEAGKLVAAAWLTENWRSAPPFLCLILVTLIGVLMSLNAMGVFGFLTRSPRPHDGPGSGAGGQDRRH